MLFKFVVVFNWIVIAILAFLVIAEFFSPHKGGGDAAGRGMGQALVMLAWIALAVLLVLNLLPYRPTKYVAFGLVAVPFLYFQFAGPVRKVIGGLMGELNAKPMFADRERNRIVEAIWKGDPARLQKALAAAPADSLRTYAYSWELLEQGIRAGEWADRIEDHRECLRVLLRAGMPLIDPDGETPALHVAALTKPELLYILLEHGADPNARTWSYGDGAPRAVPFIFEAMETDYSAYECVRLLLEHGADANAVRPAKYENPPMSIFYFAASRKRYDLCRLLLEHGANPRALEDEQDALRQWLRKADPRFPDRGIEAADIEAVKTAVLGVGG